MLNGSKGTALGTTAKGATGLLRRGTVVDVKGERTEIPAADLKTAVCISIGGDADEMTDQEVVDAVNEEVRATEFLCALLDVSAATRPAEALRRLVRALDDVDARIELIDRSARLNSRIEAWAASEISAERC